MSVTFCKIFCKNHGKWLHNNNIEIISSICFKTSVQFLEKMMEADRQPFVL